MMRIILNVVLVLCFTFSTPTQYVTNAKAGLITCAEGAVLLDGEPFHFNAENLRQLPDELSLQTTSGRVEVQLGLAASLWMGEDGSLNIPGPERGRSGEIQPEQLAGASGKEGK